MKNLFNSMLKELREGRNVVLVTVIASSGSTPRGEGARMLVGGTGRIFGTIGGGSVEFEAQSMAAELLRERKSDSRSFILKPNQAQDIGMVCGGDVALFFQYIDSGRGEVISLLENAVEKSDGSAATWLVTKIDGHSNWEMFLADRQSRGLPAGLLKNDSVYLDDGGEKYFAEPFVNSGFVYIFGGGHVAQELEPVLSHLGFRCVLFDDRPEFASRELFPSAEEIILGDFDAIPEKVSITENDYIIVMTRGHKYDYIVQRHALTTKACYIGVIGSRSKIKYISEQLMREGFGENDLKRVHTPIGISIKAETPAEIAISIAAELIQTRAELTAPN